MEKKRRTILAVVIIIIIGIILAIMAVSAKAKETATIGIIGGADGPTAILVAGKVGGETVAGAILVGIILIVVGVIIYRKVKKR